jgi:lipopolysaccharide export system permease protein
MNDYFLPLGILKYNRLRKQIVQSDPAVEVEPHSVKRMNGTTLVIGGVGDDGSIDDLVIFDKDSSGRDRVIVTGRSEVTKSEEPGILMQFNMSGATVLEVDRAKGSSFDVFESQRILLNVFDSILMPSEGVQPREMTSYDLWKIIQIMKKDESVTHKMMNRYNLEFAKKFSMPFGSVFFALLAFPLALVFGKRDGQTLGMIFGIIISVAYWAASILGQMFGVRSGWNGFWMMWGPNFFIGLMGLLLYLALRKK